MPQAFDILLQQRLEWLQSINFSQRLAQRDGTLWSTDPATVQFCQSFTGWVDVATRTRKILPELLTLKAQLLQEGYTDAVVLGMGGSSLSALMFAKDFPQSGSLDLHVLDSTNPADVLALQNKLDLTKTLFIVASKSGTTVEPLAMEEYFYHLLPAETRANQMVAITDPGSEMHSRAQQRGYRHIFLGEPEVGGRFSVFSPFGIVPATLHGYNPHELLDAAGEHQPNGPAHHDALVLGTWLATCAATNHNIVTIVTDPNHAVGLWTEQLVAESTGKLGKGILPLALEPLASNESYAENRAFLFIGTRSFIDQAKSKLQLSPQRPILERTVDKPADLAALLYDLEVATAIVGATLQINPFDQPNVQQAKDIAKARLKLIQESGSIDLGTPTSAHQDLQIFNGPTTNLAQDLSDFFNDARPGDHVGILAFLPETEETTAAIQSLRQTLLTRLNSATSLGYGPRYLHSTGQFHKGGPSNQRFLVITSNHPQDIEIPGMNATFAQLVTAQALGDIQALKENARPTLHLHITSPQRAPLKTLLQILSPDNPISN